jgi:hypothetical protein
LRASWASAEPISWSSSSPRELDELSGMRFDPELAGRVAGAATAVGT